MGPRALDVLDQYSTTEVQTQLLFSKLSTERVLMGDPGKWQQVGLILGKGTFRLNTSVRT